MEDLRGELVEALADRLEALLARIEGGGDADARSLVEAWTKCAAAFDALRAENEARPDKRVSPALRERLDHVLRLHAVALSTVGRAQDALGERFAEIKGIRRFLATNASGGARVGGSCDMRG